VLLLFLNTVGALQLFTEPLILYYYQTNAVPVNYTPTLYIYWTTVDGQDNLAAAAAVVLRFVIVAISAVSLLFRRRQRGMA
jgi:multiple sugar transport system permease protein